MNYISEKNKRGFSALALNKMKKEEENTLYPMCDYELNPNTRVFLRATTAKEIESRCYQSFPNEHFDDEAARLIFGEEIEPEPNNPIVADEALLKARIEINKEN